MNLPVRNLRVFVANVDWEAPVAERTEAALRKTLGSAILKCAARPSCWHFRRRLFPVTARCRTWLVVSIAPWSFAAEDRPVALVFVQNVGQVVGGMLSAKWDMPCIDEVSLSELDFIDVGEVVESEGFVPVVIKSLTFGV